MAKHARYPLKLRDNGGKVEGGNERNGEWEASGNVKWENDEVVGQN